MTGSVQAKALLRDSLVWDNHACVPLRPHDTRFLPELERHRAAGTDVLMVNIGYGEDDIEAHVRMLASLRDWLARHPERYRVLQDVTDIAAAREHGQMAIGFDIEGANAIGDQLSLVRLYHALGVRWMLLAYNRRNRVGGGCQEDDEGLSDFGRALLVELAEVGMLTCCSHTGLRTAREAIDASPTPVIFSHSNARALQDHPRNIPDDLIQACAARGGVVGVNGIGIFLGGNDASARNVVRHVAHIADLVGVQHVGLGLDYVFGGGELDAVMAADPTTFPPHLGYGAGMRMFAPEDLPVLVDELLGHGFNTADVAAILGGNWMRIARQVWK